MEIKKVRVNVLYFAPLRFIRQEWSVAPSIFNIKARGLAHCLYWIKLGLNEVYEVSLHAMRASNNDRHAKQKKTI